MPKSSKGQRHAAHARDNTTPYTPLRTQPTHPPDDEFGLRTRATYPRRYAPSVAACRGPGTADRPPTDQATGQVCTGVPECISSP
ncbi:hypothetical protein Stsp01_18230 [Streptomyces sp. NBRC 13847]|nr:hypothetical protein Stsp01_18230 [Streptomyces sp. NBRC 13847]